VNASHGATRPDHHPLVNSGAVLVGSYVVVSLVMLALGELLVHVLLDGPVGRWDGRVTSWLADHRTDVLNRVTSWATYIANTEAVVGIALFVSLLLLLRRRWRDVILLMGGLVVEVTVFLTVNYIVDRPRPDVPRLNETPSTSSFPSGHVAASLVMWTSIALLVRVVTTNRFARAVAWGPGVVLPALIAFARVYRGTHHPTDVLAGAILGVLALVAGVLAARTFAITDSRRRVVDQRAEPPSLETAGVR
jgi:membrane-associated phospholipid phosphatase